MGAAAGLAYDQWMRFMMQLKSRPPMMPFLSSQTAQVLSVIAYARALDLPKLKDATAALDVLKKHFAIDHGTLRYVGKILQTEAPQSADVHAQLYQLKEACRLKSELHLKVVLCLLDLACHADGHIDRVSLKAIQEAGASLGLRADEWRGLVAHYNLGKMDDDPYAVIGVSPCAPAHMITQAYHGLMRETHPDRWAGESNVFARARLQERAARINAAYEKLKKIRA